MNISKAIVNRIVSLFRKPVLFNDLNRITPISPVFGCDRGTPIDRYYIENFLRTNGYLIKGSVLEIAESHYSKLFSRGQVEAFEVLHATSDNKDATIVGDLTDIKTLPENRVDCFICTQTFNVIFELQKAIEGAHYILKPGGVLLATVPGISQISRFDMDRWGDYWRFTTASIKRLFEPVFKGGVDIQSFGNVMAACAFLQGVAVEDLPNKSLLDSNIPGYEMLITIVARKAQ